MNQTTPEVSVIIPVYNSALYLEECLNSVLNQTLRDIEIICVDDGSTDGSLEILRQFEAEHGIILLTRSHRGVSAARNAGIDKASGKFLYFMDSDDVLREDALKKAVRFAESRNLDITHFNGVTFTLSNEFGGVVIEQNTLMKREHQYPKLMTGAEMMEYFFRNNEYWMTAWLYLYRRSFCREHNLRFYEGIIHEDNLFAFLCLLSADRCAYIPETLYRKRIRPNSITTVPVSFDNAYGYFICHREMRDYLAEHHPGSSFGAAEAIMMKELSESRRVYSQLSREEQFRFYSLPYGEQIAFRTLVADYFTTAASVPVKEEVSRESGEEGSRGTEEKEISGSIIQPGKSNKWVRFLRSIFHKLLPSSRYNVAWSYQHLTAQLQVQTEMLGHLMSMDCNTRQALYDNSAKLQDNHNLFESGLRTIIDKNEEISERERVRIDEAAAASREQQSRTENMLHNLSYSVEASLASETLPSRPEMDPNEQGSYLKAHLLRDGDHSVTPDISIIIPVYNVAEYLADCLESIPAETSVRIEIICINDGSTDPSLSLLLSYAERDQRISVYTQRNQGLSAARNEGICHARGRYLYFLDSDDKVNMAVLQRMLEVADADDLDFIMGNASVFYSGEENSGDAQWQKEYFNRSGTYEELYTGPGLYALLNENKDYTVSVWLYLIRKDFILQRSLWFVPGVLYEDNSFAFRMYLMAERARYLPEIICFHRVHRESIITKGMDFGYVRDIYYNYMDMTRSLEEKKKLTWEERRAFETGLENMKGFVADSFQMLDLLEKKKYLSLTKPVRRSFEAEILGASMTGEPAWHEDFIASRLKNPGMIPMELMEGALLLSGREEALKRLPKGGIAAEVGVMYGDFSERILDIIKPEHFYAIDGFWTKDIWGRKDLLRSGLSQREWYEKRFRERIPGQVTICSGLSWEELEKFEDDYFDYIYIDASHQYEDVVKDIAAAVRKTKNGGIIQFNDYTIWDSFMETYYGVIPAVNEMIRNTGSRVLYYCLGENGFDDIVVRLNK